MDILLYMLYSGEIVGVRTHVLEVVGNLYSMGHSIIYVDGRRYSPIPVEELELDTRGYQQRSIWGQIKKCIATTPLRGEALVMWKFLKEIRLFFSALGTVLRHRPDVIYRRHTLFNSDYLIARLFNIPSVREVNGIGVDEIGITNQADNITLGVINWIERFTMPKADKVIVVTSRLKEVLQKEYKVPEDKIVVIPNGANIDLFRPMDTSQARKELDLNQDAYYICFVGSLTRWHGVEGMIRSLPLIVDLCPNTQLLLVGDGPMGLELMELAKRAGVSNNVVFIGMVPYHEVPLYINASDICVIPAFRNFRNERIGTSCLKLFEYMACGKAVIGSRLSGLEILRQQSAGILAEPKNTQELATAVMKLLENKELRMQMGNNGRRYVVEYHSWEKVAKRVADVCQSLVASRKDGNTR